MLWKELSWNFPDHECYEFTINFIPELDCVRSMHRIFREVHGFQLVIIIIKSLFVQSDLHQVYRKKRKKRIITE